jgi:ubiquinone/menaquinone biosynthesis C-methylase UbiE
MYLSDGWEAQARQWIEGARTPGHDSYWRFHPNQFLRLLPPPGRQTVDIGCGEGRLARDLKELGHRIVGIDRSPSLIAAAREFDSSIDVRLADAAALPLEDASVDLAVASMCFKISTICLPPFAKWRAFLKLAGDCAWQSFIRSTLRAS